jgi:hypothetical protein
MHVAVKEAPALDTKPSLQTTTRESLVFPAKCAVLLMEIVNSAQATTEHKSGCPDVHVYPFSVTQSLEQPSL